MTAARNVEKTIEDLEFLDESRVGAIEAAERLGFATANAMQVWLREHDALDLWKAMHARDPEGASINARPVESAPKPTPPNATLVTLLDAADATGRKALANKAQRIRDLVAELRAAVEAETARVEVEREARADIERLQRELAEAKAKLRTGPATATVTRITAPKGDFPCPDCGKHFDTVQGLGMHRRRHCPNRQDEAS
jgi:hypothetical protein